MKTVNYKSSDNRYTVQYQVENDKQLFEETAKFEEIFGNNLACGHCQSKNVRNSVRVVVPSEGKMKGKSCTYYERICNECDYKFAFGQRVDDGSLFPKHDQGWTKYTAKDEQ